jgi:large subunit ribosomal protein L2
MAVKKYNPTSAGRRFITTADFSGVSKKDPEKSLLEVKKKHSGRNNNGHITTRHKGGGTRKQYRIIDFKRSKDRSGEGRGDRVRSQPHRPDRTAALPRR